MVLLERYMQLAKELELDRYEGFLVSYNGSQVYDVKKEEISLIL